MRVAFWVDSPHIDNRLMFIIRKTIANQNQLVSCFEWMAVTELTLTFLFLTEQNGIFTPVSLAPFSNDLMETSSNMPYNATK